MHCRAPFLTALSVLCVGIGAMALAGDPPARVGLSAGAELVEPWTGSEMRLRLRLLEIAGEYHRYGRVDDEARWAPYDCRMPLPSVARFSAADGRDAHAQKLYFLFACDRAAYVNLDRPKDKLAPAFQVGAKGDPQVVVKEAWMPKLHEGEKPAAGRDGVMHDPPDFKRSPFGGSYYPYAVKDGKTYHTAKKAGLFVMFQVGSKLADEKLLGAEPLETDAGWLYGTLTADGKTVTAAGKIASCMECHQQAPHGRLFGLAGKPQKAAAAGGSGR